MDPRWKDVAESGDIDGLYSLIGEEALFADTPLHVAARAGNTHVALEIANLNPSFARKLNQSGFSPLHLTIAGGHKLLATGLVKMDSELVLFQGREGRTPVHEAAIPGNIGLLRKFLSACPRAFEALTFKLETALHLAVKHNQLEAFEFMMRWLRHNNNVHVLEWKDDNGDTILHMAAASTHYHEVIKSLSDVIKSSFSWSVEVNAKNSQNLTALDVFDRELTRDPLRSMTRYLLCRAGALRAQDTNSDTPFLKIRQWPQDNTSDTPSLKGIWWPLPMVNLREWWRYFQYRKGRDSPNDVRNALLVCAVLIATATYQAAFSPPGGTWQDTFIPLRNSSSTTTTTTPGEEHPHYAGKSTLGRLYFLIFLFFNSLGFFLSISMILALIAYFPLHGLLHMSLLALIITYLVAILVVAPTRSRENEPIYTFLLIFFSYFFPVFVCILVPPYPYLFGISISRFPKFGLFKIFQRHGSGGNT